MSFREIIGQPGAIPLLKAAYKQDRISHAYVFAGPDGVGKKKTALNFAKLLICENAQKEEPCDRCASCLKVEAGNHPDVYLLAPDGQFIKIDAVREACRRLSLVGFESRKKVLIIQDAQALNEESSNALLKTLEEPTQGSVIILITDTLKSVLPTIASRCQRVMFSPLKEELVRSVLRSQWGAGADEAFYLARFCAGSLGEAVRLQKEGLFSRKNRIIGDLLDKGYPLKDFFQAYHKDRNEVQGRINEALAVLSSWFEDMLLAKISNGPEDFVNIDRKEDIMRCSQSFSFEEIEARMQVIAETKSDVEHNANMRIALTRMRYELWK